MIERVKCNCGHAVEEHESWSNCTKCECKRVERRPLTDHESELKSAFWAGANYSFTRLGRWYGKGQVHGGIMFYMSYFKTCEEQGHTPHLVSMIAEEVHGVALEYAYGMREDLG